MAWLQEHGGKVWGAVIATGVGAVGALIRTVLKNNTNIAVMQQTIVNLSVRLTEARDEIQQVRSDLSEWQKLQNERHEKFDRRTAEMLGLLTRIENRSGKPPD